MARRAVGVNEDGMVGMLITVLVIGVMATIALVSLERAGDGAAPAAGPRTGEGAVPSVRGVSPLVDIARAKGCVKNAGTIAAAAQLYQVTHGAWPATVQDLRDAGLLATVPSGLGYTYAIDQASGQVLVNGATAAAGCAAPASG